MLIYALRDPNDQAIRYIGATKDRDSRMHKHLSQHRRPIYRQWIAGLKEKGMEPEFIVLEEVSKDAWPLREKHWLAHYRKENAPLLNLRDGGGGGGVADGPRSESHRMNLSKALMGHTVSEETRKRISKTKAERKHTYKKTKNRRRMSHCKRGHELTPDNVEVRSSGERRCRICARAYGLVYRSRTCRFEKIARDSAQDRSESSVMKPRR